jgi:hypothetical protein
MTLTVVITEFEMFFPINKTVVFLVLFNDLSLKSNPIPFPNKNLLLQYAAKSNF